MDKSLENACRGKSLSQGGLNVPDFKKRLALELPEYQVEIKKASRGELEKLCMDKLLILKKPTKPVQYLMTELEKHRPKMLPFPDFRKAEKVLNKFVMDYSYDKTGHKNPNFPREWQKLYNYAPWNTFVPEFTKYMENNSDFNEMLQNGIRDMKSAKSDYDIQEMKYNVILSNFDYFAHEFMEYLRKGYGYIFKEISEDKYDSKKFTLIDYTYNPAKYFVLQKGE